MDDNLSIMTHKSDGKTVTSSGQHIHLLTSLRSVSSSLIGSMLTSMPTGLLVDGSVCFDAHGEKKIHLADRRRAIAVCGEVVPARQIGTYAESLLILGDRTIVRREVYAFLTRVKRRQRCKKCFRSAERFL